MALAADEESGAVDADAMVEEEEQRSSASSSSSSDDESNDKKYNGVYTKEDFPGADAFASWLGRAGVDPEKDHSVDAFMGKLYVMNDTNDSQLAFKSITNKESDADNSVEVEEVNETNTAVNTKHNADYQLYDTAVWRERKRSQIARTMGKMNDRREGGGNPLDPRRWRWRRHQESDATVDAGKATRKLEKIRRYGTRILVILIGVVMALIGYAIVSASDYFHEVKINYAQTYMPDWSKGFGIHVGISLVYITIAFIPVAYCPIVAGSGIDYAKAILNGVNVPEATTLTTLFCKAFGIVFTSAASLPVGIEGPMIHSGLCLGANAWKVIPRSVQSFDTLFGDRARRDLSAIGTAAGVAAAFLSPIGGILFAMEEGASFWSILLMWKCVSASTTCIVVWYFLAASKSGFGAQEIPLKTGFWESASSATTRNDLIKVRFWEYFLIAAVGLVAGLVGGLWVQINIRLTTLRRRLALSKPLKLLEVMFFTVLMACLTWFLPIAYTVCKDQSEYGKTHYIQFNCPSGQYNELATLLLSPPSTYGLRHTFHSERNAFSIQSLVITGCVYLLVLLFLFGASIVMGIFIPLLYAGSCFGRALALSFGDSFQLNVTLYAIVGASAMLCGVVRVVISLTIIVLVESTGLPLMMAPLIISNIAARSMGNKISKKSIYEKLLELKDIPFLEEEPPKVLTHRMLHARDLMASRPFVKLPSEVEVAYLVKTLKECSDHGQFPVLHGDQFIGMISQSDLLVLLAHKGLFYESSEQGGPRRCITHSELRKIYPITLNFEEVESSLTEEDKSCYLDLAPYVQIAPYTFEAHGSAERTYELYRTLGLRSLVVVDNNARPIGEIRRRDLYSFQEEEPELMKKMKAA